MLNMIIILKYLKLSIYLTFSKIGNMHTKNSIRTGPNSPCLQTLETFLQKWVKSNFTKVENISKKLHIAYSAKK